QYRDLIGPARIVGAHHRRRSSQANYSQGIRSRTTGRAFLVPLARHQNRQRHPKTPDTEFVAHTLRADTAESRRAGQLGKDEGDASPAVPAIRSYPDRFTAPDACDRSGYHIDAG